MQIVNKLTYDELGRITKKGYGTSTKGLAMTYDIRNRIRSIGDQNLTYAPFWQDILYETNGGLSGVTPQYGGNISAIRWKNNSATIQSYIFSYDAYDRLTSAIHSGGNSEQGLTYDANGNITALSRSGNYQESLTYTYSGNRLTSLSRNGTSLSYSHDGNGNMTADGLRGFDIEYNIINLPKQISKGVNNTQYIYDAQGNKLAVKQNGQFTAFYCGEMVYKSDKTLDYALTGTGLVKNNNTSAPEYLFHLTDHLGSVRAVVNQNSTLIQSTDYYPFGLTFETTETNRNRYLYNGKEYQTEELSGTPIGTYDYGARMYDPRIARWGTVDPMSEKYYNISPYTYCANNPIRYVDPTGLSHSEFDENGNYLRTTKDNWWHNTFVGRTGRIVDGNGNVTQKFKFADPKNDVQDLKDGKINRVQFVQESEIISMLSYAGAFNYENKTANSDSRYGYISEEGKGEGRFDFAVTGIPNQYSDYNQSLFLVDGVAHNRFNYGNFLFGAAGKALGLTSFELRMGAHYNSVFNPSTNGYKPQLDSRDDQFSIRMGVRHANKHGYKNMYYRVTVGPLQKP